MDLFQHVTHSSLPLAIIHLLQDKILLELCFFKAFSKLDTMGH